MANVQNGYTYNNEIIRTVYQRKRDHNKSGGECLNSACACSTLVNSSPRLQETEQRAIRKGKTSELQKSPTVPGSARAAAVATKSLGLLGPLPLSVWHRRWRAAGGGVLQQPRRTLGVTGYARSARAVDMRRRAIQRCSARRLGLGARAPAVVSRDDGATLSKPNRGVFCKKNEDRDGLRRSVVRGLKWCSVRTVALFIW
jgi:hypothetical protein